MTSSDHRRTVILPILLTCAAYACYCVTDAVVKNLAGHYHFTQIVFINCLCMIPFLSVYGWVTEGRKAFVTRQKVLVGARAVISQLIGICTIQALPHIQLTTFYAMIFTSPFIVALLSMFFLGEKPGRRRIGIILAGFSVILFIFRPGGGLLNPWVALVGLGAFLYSLQMILIRKIMRAETGESRTFFFLTGCILGALWTAPLMPGRFVMPTTPEMGLFLFQAGFGCVGMVCMARAFQTARSVSIVAPFHYTQIIWAAVLGWVFFNDVPDVRVMWGAGAIISLGLYLMFSEREEAPAVTPAEAAA